MMFPLVLEVHSLLPTCACLLTSFLHLNVYMIMFVLGLVGSLKTKPNPCLCKNSTGLADLIFGDQVHPRWSFETSSELLVFLLLKMVKPIAQHYARWNSIRLPKYRVLFPTYWRIVHSISTWSQL